MKLFKLKRSQLVTAQRDEVFEFFSNPENLEKITPKELSFKILTPGSIPMHIGTVIDYSINIFGVPMRWTSLITQFKEPHLFVDLQIKGPYAYWHHMHRFVVVSEGTLIEDEVHYQLPLGHLGRLAHQLVVKQQLTSIFDHRAKVINDLFVSPRPGPNRRKRDGLESD